MGKFYEALGLSITIISGYLIVAYAVGLSLTRSQMILINLLFVGTMAFMLGGLNGFGGTAGDAELTAWAMTSQRTWVPTPWVRWGVIVFIALMVFASLKFMNDVRHPKQLNK